MNVASEILNLLRTKRETVTSREVQEAAETIEQMEALAAHPGYQRLVTTLTEGYEAVIDRMCVDPTAVPMDERVLAVAKRLIASGPQMLLDAAHAVLAQAREDANHGGPPRTV